MIPEKVVFKHRSFIYQVFFIDYIISTYTFNQTGVGVKSMDTDGQEESDRGVKPYFQHG